MLRFIASRYASWPPAVTTVAGSSAIVTGVAVVATVALHRRDDGPESDRRRHRQRGSKVFQDSAIPRAGCGCARREKRDTTMTVVRAAAVQISPALYSREGTFDKVVQKIAELGRRGVQFATFPEAVVPYYPYFSFLQSPFEIGPEHLRLIDQAVTIPSPATHAIGEAARQSEMVVSIGVNERDGGTLFNAQLLFDADGSMRQRRRKISATYHERIIWGQGDGSGLRAVVSAVGRIGQLACWEHYNPLARYALIADGEQIHSGMWPGSFGGELFRRADRGQHPQPRTRVGCFRRERHRLARRRSAGADRGGHGWPGSARSPRGASRRSSRHTG